MTVISGWQGYVDRNFKWWYDFHNHWLTQDICLLVVTYSNLHTHLRGELRRIAHFLNVVNMSEEQLDCVVKHSQGSYKRPGHPVPPGLFTAQMNNTIDAAVEHVLRLVQKWDPSVKSFMDY